MNIQLEERTILKLINSIPNGYVNTDGSGEDESFSSKIDGNKIDLDPEEYMTLRKIWRENQ